MGQDKGVKMSNEATSSMLQALTQYGPDAIRALSDVAEYPAAKTLAIEQRDAPAYAALQNQVYSDYGPEANRIGSQIARDNALAASETERQLAEGPGRELVGLADAEQRALDPEFYASRAAVGKGITDFLGSYSPTELTPTEIEQINRGISAREGPVTPSALRTIKNAQTFGDAATNRWKNFGEAVTMASSALPNLKSGLTGFEIATRRPLTSNTGDSRLSTPSANNATSALDTTFGFGNNLLSEIGSTQRTALSKQKDAFDKVSSLTRIIGGLG